MIVDDDWKGTITVGLVQKCVDAQSSARIEDFGVGRVGGRLLCAGVTARHKQTPNRNVVETRIIFIALNLNVHDDPVRV